MYVISDGKNYVCKSGNNYILTTNKNGARQFKDYWAANNVFKSCLCKKLMEMDLHVFNLSDMSNPINEDCMHVNYKYTDIDISAIQSDIDALAKKFAEIEQNKDYLVDALSTVDKEIIDVEHFIEFQNFSASEGYKLCKAIKDLRSKRRKIKDELDILNIINNGKCRDIMTGNLNKSINGLYNRSYQPRVLTELFRDKDVDVLKNSVQYTN